MGISTKLSAMGLLCCVMFACTTTSTASATGASTASTATSSFPIVDGPKVVISDLKVLDTNAAAAGAWSFQENLQVKNKVFGDRSYPVEEIPKEFTGSNWIRSACDSKNFTGDTLALFTAPADISVFVAFDDRVSPMPEWTKGWTDTNLDIVVAGPLVMSIYGKIFPKGSVVNLGPNGQSAGCVQYFVLVK
ncbi:MAG: hypothetical protein EHM28_04610 [Spirochaetaceae bacterium]|nr:MAG: hypothetical protein EHM28_04610 [Spirochaetaceae bacterium]